MNRISKKLVIVSLCFLGFVKSQAQNYQLHSVFMYSFTRYIQWPEEANQGDFEIIVLGDSPILAELRTLAEKKKVGERTIRVTQVNSLVQVKKCHILFVPEIKSAQLNEILGKLGNSSTLVVTEQPGLAQKGSGINFIQKDGKLAFELNTAALAKQKLKTAAELTRWAILI